MNRDSHVTEQIAVRESLPETSDQVFLLDAAVIIVVSVAICFASQYLVFMSIWVPALVLLRCVIFGRLSEEKRPHSIRIELLFLFVCTILGGFNDWNSVVHHRIYDYRAPVFFQKWSSIPIWMLLYWGMILRFLVSLFRWHRLTPPKKAKNDLWIGRMHFQHPWLRVLVLLMMVLATRQCIYRFYTDPWLSWLPFAMGLLVYMILFRPARYEWGLWGLFLLGGPGIEILYIQVGGLHYYHLGWIGGVPLWIGLWWLLVVPIWNDLSGRILAFMYSRSRSHILRVGC